MAEIVEQLLDFLSFEQKVHPLDFIIKETLWDSRELIIKLVNGLNIDKFRELFSYLELLYLFFFSKFLKILTLII
ncbi:hypothetical protein FGO68_gene5540 [Halteria grandinella]|uniref:Uncharacterized protein n=1 Tax=Halteria grandinella TaxID=5974 RepID=A0A8J8SVY9_HALGN|nr:hypothetical protein FGO68_gene5540 [Halteria grandinella]